MSRLKSIPPEISAMLRLETLILDSNSITAIPPEVFSLPQLRTLSVAGRRGLSVTSSLTPCLLTVLVSLCQGNKLTSLPPDCKTAKRLEVLTCMCVFLVQFGWRKWRLSNLGFSCVSLVSRNALSALPVELGTLAELRELNLEGQRAHYGFRFPPSSKSIDLVWDLDRKPIGGSAGSNGWSQGGLPLQGLALEMHYLSNCVWDRHGDFVLNHSI